MTVRPSPSACFADCQADRAEIACGAVEPAFELFGVHIAQLARAGDIEELGFVDGVIAPQEDGERLPRAILRKRHVSEGLNVVLGQHIQEGDDVRYGGLAGGVDALRLAVAGGGEVFYGRELRGGFFEIRGVMALRAGGDQVLAGVAVDHELLRAGAAHGAGVRLDDDE